MGDFLTEEEIAYLEQMWMEHGGDMMSFMDALKPWFKEPERAARLRASGMDPGFASYAIPYHFAQFKQKQSAAEADDLVDRIMRRPPLDGDPSLN